MVETPPLPALRALADGTRLELARLLLEGPFNVGEVQEILELGQSTASHHLKILVDGGLLATRREGRLAYYQWASSLPPPLEALRAFVRDYAPALQGDARRRLHQVYETRADRSRRFFEGPGVEVLAHGQASERAGSLSADVIGPIVEQIPRGSIVADLGTGAGRLLGSLRSHASRVIGVDASPRMLERAGKLARDSGWEDVELRLGTLEHLPLRDGEADVAIAHQVIHHAAQPAIALAEARRALKPGGHLIVGDFLPHDREWMREELADQWLGFDPKTFTALLEAAGFEEIQLSRHEGRGDELGMFVASGRRPLLLEGRLPGNVRRMPTEQPRSRKGTNKAQRAARGAIS
jgi:ArsR family transcriptional regulator